MRVLVVGLGSFGFWFARTMVEMEHEVIAIEQDETLVDRYAEWLTRAIVGDGTDPNLLERVGAGEVDAAIIATGEDLSTTIMSFMALRDLGAEEVFAKARSQNAQRALLRLGVTEAVFPERDAGSRLAHRIVSKAVLDYIPLAEGYSLQEIAVPKSWTGRTLIELAARRTHEIQIVGVRDSLTGTLRVPPRPTDTLKPSDSMLLAGADDALEQIRSASR